MKKILIYARDPGGANAVLPLYLPLKNGGCEVVLCGKEFALLRYKEFGLDGIDIEGVVEEIDKIHVRAWLKQMKFDVVVTGTSGEDKSERIFWDACKKMKLKTLVVLDHWVNYAIRFSNFG
ncbi:hypothetical protein ACFL2V_06955, partial [Pseudomonadota bacterium]